MKLHAKKVALLLFVIAAYRILNMIGNRPWMRENQCEMTYMYRFMSFMRIDVDRSNAKGDETNDINYPFSSDFDSYATILYGEGVYAFNYMKTEQVSGIPVVFVPGNAGSSRQVRSLGSVLQNKTESRNLPFKFDVFAVDFNEELSGLSGMYLERQIKYLELAVEHIWSMYSPPPHGIIFVGHSMGGVVIRSLMRSAHFDAARIAFIVTLGTPHKDPPMIFDWYLKNSYNRMHDAWKERAKELANVLVLSISGGLKDQLVPEQLTFDHGIQHISTTAVDGIELETDHLCIVWCNQLVRRISRLLTDYAYDPESFHERADAVVQQIFGADGLVRKLKRAAAGSSTVTVVKNESLFFKNNGEDSKEVTLLFPKNSWLFIARSSGTSLWTDSGEPIYSLCTLRRTFYTLLDSRISTQLSVQLNPQKFFKTFVLRQDSTKLSFSKGVHVGLFSLLKGCLTSLWQAEFDGRQPAVLLPIYFKAPVVAVVISLELDSCNHTDEWFAKIEFRSQDLRRIGVLGPNKKLRLLGYLLHKENTKADVFFILDQRCRFHARLDVGYLDISIVMLRMYGSVIPFILGIYVLCSLSISTLAEEFFSDIQGCMVLCCTLFCHMLIIYWNNLLDWLSLLISSLLICSFTYLLQKLASALIHVMNNKRQMRYATSKRLSVSSFIIIATSLFVNYAYNGFFSLLIILVPSFFGLLKTTNIPEAHSNASFWLPFLLIVHFYAILVYSPFGICSVWNIIRYGFFAVYEDPVRVPAYLLIFLKFVRLGVNHVHFLKMHYVSVIVLACTVLFQPFSCIAQLGYSFIVVIGLSWFVDHQSQWKQKVNTR